MKTKIMLMDEEKIIMDDIKVAAKYIKEGEIVVFPTETVYGLGANAFSPKAISKIYSAKGRPSDNPLIVHVASKDISDYVLNISEKAKKLMAKFWPGPLTLIFDKKPIIPHETSGGLNTIGIRMPNNKIAIKFIEECGVPIAAPSANISGKPSATTVQHCIDDLNGKVSCILGSAESMVGLESTIVDCTKDVLCILRPGRITLEQLKEIDENAYIDPNILGKVNRDEPPKAPGMKYTHYAPKAPVQIIKGDLGKTIKKINEITLQAVKKGKKVGIMATNETKDRYSKDAIVLSFGDRDDLKEVAYNLFNLLREFDKTDVDLILTEAFIEEDLGVAIMNRLKKSAGFNIIEV